MKKYSAPDFETFDGQTDCIMASGELEKGEHIWNNETPLQPLH